MPRALGWILIVGGVGYTLNPFVGYLAPGAGLASAALVVLATVGEFWMIGYLLVRGVARQGTFHSSSYRASAQIERRTVGRCMECLR
jgi:hypothetical protein